MAKKRKRFKKFCAYCGSTRVSSTANTYWNFEKQEQEIGDYTDDNYCAACEGECSIGVMEEGDDGVRIGTKAVVMVRYVWDQAEPGPDFKIEASDGTDYLVYDGRRNEECLVVEDGELVVLRRKDGWQWEIIQNAD